MSEDRKPKLIPEARTEGKGREGRPRTEWVVCMSKIMGIKGKNL